MPAVDKSTSGGLTQARASLERHIINSLVTDPEYVYDVGSDADYCTPLTDRVHNLVQAARGEDLTWVNPSQEMPEAETAVVCLLRHHGTGRVRQDPLRHVAESDLSWRTLDGAELSYDWEVLAWRPLP